MTRRILFVFKSKLSKKFFSLNPAQRGFIMVPTKINGKCEENTESVMSRCSLCSHIDVRPAKKRALVWIRFHFAYVRYGLIIIFSNFTICFSFLHKNYSHVLLSFQLFLCISFSCLRSFGWTRCALIYTFRFGKCW